MTPAIQMLKRSGVSFRQHQYDHDPSWGAYGEEAAAKMGVDPQRVFKTLVAQLDGTTLVVAIIPVTQMLDLKGLAKHCSAKKAKMGEKSLVEKTTGYVAGGVSPLGQKKTLKTIIDESGRGFETIYVSGGKRGLDIELNPEDLAQLTRADFARISK